MKIIQYKILIACLAIIIFFPLGLKAQANDTTLQKLITLRDSFINQIKVFSFNPSLPPPKIVLDNPRSFGNYDSAENILHSTDWKTLPPEAKRLFESLASQMGNGETPEDVFEKGTHEWIFIHELGHWWRACQHQKALPYDEEMAANRIATAFWRERDTMLMNFQLNVFKGFIAHIPSPVPAGQSKRDFLNSNYNKLPGGPAYTWFQSEMIVDAYNEKPILSFKQAITDSGN
ncbi:MAG: hypothetical protein M3Z26_13010 [Bacteroidota bacterium]|nr:hypothetical protein [Bacteroidota bacterium]